MFFDPQSLLEQPTLGDESMPDEKNTQQDPPAISAIPAIFDQNLVNENGKIAGIAKIADPYAPTFFDGGTDNPSAENSRNSENSSTPLADIFHGFSLSDLQAECHADEWPDVRDNPKALAAFALALLEDRQIQAGVKPERFMTLMYCPGCGVVPLPTTWPSNGLYEALSIPQVNGCRWCGNRITGKHYPKAYPLAPNDYDGRQNGRWPYSEDCRPIAWQGRTEREVNK
jgi:hypothetical protein